MTFIRIAAVLTIGLALTACGTMRNPPRSASFGSLAQVNVTLPDGRIEQTPGAGPFVSELAAASGLPHRMQIVDKVPAGMVAKSPVHVKDVLVIVPEELVVSEANQYIPPGDIVWREDPIGNRHEQVKVIVENAMRQGVEPLDGPIEVNITVQIERFHALSEKARYTTGGIHALTFLLGVYDAETGELLTPVRRVVADLDAFGGKEAMIAESNGLTQKVRITNHLAEVIRQELTYPDGYQTEVRGIMRILSFI